MERNKCNIVNCVHVQVNEAVTETSLLLPEDFKAFSKLRVENQYYNKYVLTYNSRCPKTVVGGGMYTIAVN